LLIPGQNDSTGELEALTNWVVENLGPDVPLHFSAFHPDYKMRNIASTPPATLTRARRIAVKNGIRYAYTGNVYDADGGSTYCHECHGKLIGRNWYHLGDWNLAQEGHCLFCDTECAGYFYDSPGSWGGRRQAVRLANYR